MSIFFAVFLVNDKRDYSFFYCTDAILNARGNFFSVVAMNAFS